MRRGIYAVTVTLALLAFGSLVSVRMVSAHVNQATIDPMATRAIGGSYAVITGAISCTTGESFQINVTMGQSATGAQARGSVAGTCTSRASDWKVTALTQLDSSLLQPGVARVCWNAATYLVGQSTDVHRNCSTVTLASTAIVAFPQ